MERFRLYASGALEGIVRDECIQVKLDPGEDLRGDFGGMEVGGFNGVATPGDASYGGRMPGFPAHFFPAAVEDDFRAVAVVGHVVAHPLGKGDVSGEIVRSVAALGESLNVFVWRDIEETDLDACKLACTGRGVEFAGRDWIAAQQKMLS